MGQLPQAVSPRDNFLRQFPQGTTSSGSSPKGQFQSPDFKTASTKEPDSFDDTQAWKLRGFVQSRKIMLHNDPENVFPDRKKALY
ncbi:hypothetical protein O181_121819 [Austropuccinia psidii MF-1]|uniref:Uncharacterized protein n=1 Tax=Austropuccinia psidii MF-1 TaxID=1389203 RepID=A0A9Q3KJC6_9BASI|nr:hypothetical protein [Austropuccinia psidii MF-1]